VKDACESFEPDTNSLVLTGSKRLKYDILVVCVGIQQNFDQIPGLEETIGKNGVCSIYSYKYSPIVWESIQNLKKGTAIFTNPKTAVSCGGAPQKIAYLADCEWRRQGVRGQIDLHFHTATPGIFGCPSYRVELEKLMAEKHIHPHVQSNLVAVDGHSQTATFELEGGERVQRKFDLLHVTPPMSPPAFVKKSPLANAAGFIDVDKYTCQHVRYPNVFALGDSSSLPTSKTYSAVSAESPVVVHNIKSMLEDPSATFASYDGYTACPILLGGKKLMLAEFNGYTNDPVSTFWPLNQRKGSHLFFLMKRFVFEQVYWHFMPVGRWFGKHTIFHPKLRLKSSSEGNR
jgi:sulfide:quinone oxidoreductase